MEAWEHRFFEEERKDEQYQDAYDYMYDELKPFFETIGGIAKILTEKKNERFAHMAIIDEIPDEDYDESMFGMKMNELVDALKDCKQVVENLQSYLDSLAEEYASSSWDEF